MTYAPARPAPATSPDSTTSRNVTKWIIALALFFSLLLFFGAVQAFQITSEGASERTLRRAVAVVSEVDVLLDRHYEDLRQRAESVPPNETLELQDFPVSVPLTPAEVQTQSRDELRETLLDRAAATMYQEGTGAMRVDASTGDVAVFSLGGSIDRSLNLLRSDAHIALGMVMAVTGGISLLLAVSLVAATRGFGRVVALGATALVAALTILVVLFLGRLSLDADGSSEYVRVEFLKMAREITTAPIRDSAILVALSAIITAMGAAAARLTDTGDDRGDNRAVGG